MKRFADISLPYKLLIVGIAIFLVFSAVLFGLYAYVHNQASINAYVEKARAICLTAESTRQQMEEKWTQGLFTIEQMKGFQAEGNLEKMLAAVPVVTAWKAAMSKADRGGYAFRVPKFSPRNPKNQPDYGLDYEIEGPALKKIKAENLSEYYVIDEKANAVRYFLPVRLTEICLICHGDPKQSKTLWGRDDGKDPTGGIIENWKTGEVHGAFEVVQSLDQADQELRDGLLRGGLVVIIAIIIAVIIFFLIAKSITRPIIEGVAFAEKMSEGDLSQTLDIDQKDEVGNLAASMNHMVANLGGMFKDIAGGIEKLFSASTELSSISQKMSTSTEQTSIKSNTVAAAAEEMSANMNAVAAAVEETSTNVELVASAAEEMTATINEIAQNSERSLSITEKAVTQAQSASEKVDELGKAVMEIGEVTDTITEISEKTDLLALNATIEAARAGESGKGFAVVASEIKQLAKQTSDSTQRISQRIKLIQDSTSDTIREIEQISSVIDNVNEIVSTIAAAVEEQSITTKEIASNVAQASKGVQEVSENVTQSSTAANEVAKDIAEVDQSSLEISNSSAQVQTSAEELEMLAEQLKGFMEKFKF